MLCELYCDPHLNKEGLCLIHCADRCPDICKYVVMPDSSVAPFLPGLLPPPSPPPPPHGLVVLPSIPRQVPPIRHVDHFNRHHLIVISTVITACLIGTALLFCAAYTLIKRFNSRRNNSRSRNTPILFDTTTHQDFLDEHEGPILDHPIWYINTVGFQQSVIDSISMLKYKKDEGLIDGTDCSICLGEFQEEESLRLLPKCSHAFHLPCIDTWLRSHKNCPLCRAPIFANNTGPHSDGSSSREETRIEILDGNNGISDQGNNQIDSNEDVVDNMLQRDNGRDEDMMFDEIPRWNRGNFEWRVLSDLTENRELVKEEVEPIRRSVSLDSLSASMIHQAMASDATRLVVDARDMDSEEKVVKGEGRGKIELVKSSSMRHSVQKGSVSMKRSFSSSRKLFLSRHSRGQSSILPL